MSSNRGRATATRQSMRALFVAHPVTRDIFGDGNFLVFWDIAEELVDHYDHHCYFLVEEVFRESYERRYPEGRPGITMVYDSEMSQYSIRDRHRFVTPKLILDTFSRRYGAYQIDWVYVAEPEQTALLKSLISDGSKKEVTVQAVTMLVRQSTSVRARTSDTEWIPVLDTPSSMSRALGYLAGYPTYPTKFGKDIVSAEYNQWLSAYGKKEVDRRSIVLPHMLCRSTFDITTKKRDEFTVMFGGRLSTDKNIKMIAPVMRAVAAQGAKVEIATSTTTIRNKDIRDFVTQFKSSTHLGMQREPYLRIAAECHASICASEYEGFGTAFLEQTFLRCPTVLLRAEWVKHVFPEWYPWLFDTKEEAVTHLLRMKDEWHTEEFQKTLNRVVEWITARYGYEPIMQQLTEFINRVQDVSGNSYEEQFYTPPAAQLEALARAVEVFRGKSMPLHALTRIISRFHKFFKHDRLQRGQDRLMMSDYDIYRILLTWGLLDDTTKPFTTFHVPANWTRPSADE